MPSPSPPYWNELLSDGRIIAPVLLATCACFYGVGRSRRSVLLAAVLLVFGVGLALLTLLMGFLGVECSGLGHCL